jgi:glutathione synthase/RimK-type ligase-like ATP-grasp enzyme
MLLILTSKQDLAADFLIVELIKRHLPYFRLNCEDLADAEYEFRLNDRCINRYITVDQRFLDVGDVRAVWYRRAIHPRPSSPLSAEERFFVAGEIRHLAAGLILNPDILWVNPIENVSAAEHKIYQLQLARNLGFNTPRTIVSCHVDELKKFVADNPTGTICKPIFHGMFFDGTSRHAVYTRRVKLASLDANSVGLCPVLLQEEIPRSADVRVTLIGPYCFTADVTGEPSLIDWRDPKSVVNYSIGNLDPATEVLCRKMLAQLGLVYGAFDFIRSADGKLVFLEVNPTGEWAWLEDRLGFPMRSAFVDVFYGATPWPQTT